MEMETENEWLALSVADDESLKKIARYADAAIYQCLKSAFSRGSKVGYKEGYEAGRKDAQKEHSELAQVKGNAILPMPCNGKLYESWRLQDYGLKVSEEAGEVTSAILRYLETRRCSDENLECVDTLALKPIAWELGDVIVAATSTLEHIGYGLKQRSELFKEINESNAKRDGGRRV